MSFTNLIAKMKRFEKNREIIFDGEEPIGSATDLVMPRRRWFRRDPKRAQKHSTSMQPIQL